jgi:hypothetical protein
MPWTASHMFRQWIADCLTHTATPAFATDTFTVALYGNTITPDENATAVLSAYNAASSAWLTAGELYQAGQWAQGGVSVSGGSGVTNFTGTADAVWFSASNTASGSACTLAGVYGDLLYDATLTTPVAGQGVCFHYYGGSQSVTAGTFTVIWNVNGLWRISV